MKITNAIAVLVVAALLQNIATGSSYGTYGVILADLTQEFGVSRALAALGLSLVALAGGLSAPWIGRAIDRWSLRRTVLFGALCGAAGMAVAATAPNFGVFLTAFALLIGIAAMCCGSLQASALANRCFPARAGLVVALVNLPLAVSLGPPLFGWITAQFGWRTLLAGMACVYLLMLLPLALIDDRTPARTERAERGSALQLRDLLRDRNFWLLGLSVGVLCGNGISAISHIVAFAMEQGVERTQAALLISVSGSCAVVGGLALGSLSDRVGAPRTLAFCAALTCLAWIALSGAHAFVTMVACIVCTGFCGGGVVAPMSAYIARKYGTAAFGFVAGATSQLVVPFTFGMPLLVGILYDATGGYRVPLLLQAALSATALVMLMLLVSAESSNTAPKKIAAAQ